MSEELKPCPFCGATNIEPDYVNVPYGLECKSCGASGPPDSQQDPDEAIAAWNQRTQPKVKALEWEDSGDDQSWAKTPFGEVSVQDYVNRTGWTMDICGDDLGEKPTRNEAKRYVEKEAERRVLACLEGYDE